MFSLCLNEKDSCPIEFNPKLYKRYVLDIFVMFRSGDHDKKFVQNTKHPNISFLDIKIFSNTEKKEFETSVYRQSTFNGVFTNFKSFIPMTYKTRLHETMLFGCFSTCSSYEKFDEKNVKLKRNLYVNSYPEKRIGRCNKFF